MVSIDEQLSAHRKRTWPLVRVIVSVFQTDPDNLDAPPLFLLGRSNPERYGKTIWSFPSSYIRLWEWAEDAAMRVLREKLSWIDATLATLVMTHNHRDDFGWFHVISLHYVFVYKEWEAEANAYNDQFAWLNASQVSQLPHVESFVSDSLPELFAAIRNYSYDTDELLSHVDKDDKEIGYISKRRAHSDRTSYHRAIHVVHFTSKGELVLQKRSSRKERYGGKWAYHGWHVPYGQTPEQTVKHEIIEELWIEWEFSFMKKWLLQTDYESQHTYVYSMVHDGPFLPNKNEVDEVKAFDCEILLAGGFDEEHDMLPWVKEYVSEMRNFWEGLKEG